jgi:uncharacterized protein YcbK (DUF882 family)
MTWTRRRLLTVGGTLAGATAVSGLSLPLSAAAASRAAAAGAPRAALAAASRAAETGTVKRLSLYNLHTGERLEPIFFRDGAYVPESLAAIDVLLRDFRTGEKHVIDPSLMDTLYDVAQRLGAPPVFSVISGYRSPQTNARLRELGSGVARQSLHLQGRAIDVRLAGVRCDDLAARALEMERGGVGYYRQSDFVHLDTGVFRTWKG